MEISIGGVKSTPLTERSERFTAIIWGPAKSGKTTLASTAPKPILFLMFDPDGAASLRRDPDVHVIDLSKSSDSVVGRFKATGTQELNDIEKAVQDGCRTIVLDSLTSFGAKALMHGIAVANTLDAHKSSKPSLEAPGFGGYGMKSMFVNRAVVNLLAITQRHNANFIALGHEDAGQKSKEGNIIKQTLLLGSSLVVEIPKDVSEVWYMHDMNGRHEVLLRPRFPLTPMGSRMFDTRNSSSFYWKYDPVEGKGEGIASWLEAWKTNSYNKIALPK